MTHPGEKLSAFHDGELPEGERRVIEAHLAGCAECTRHLREIEALDAFARATPLADAPVGYHAALPGRVRERLRGGARGIHRSRPWVWPLAAGLALAVLAPIVLRQQGEPMREVAPAPASLGAAPAAGESAESGSASAPERQVALPPAAAPVTGAEGKARLEAKRAAPQPPAAAKPRAAAPARRDAPAPQGAERDEFAAEPPPAVTAANEQARDRGVPGGVIGGVVGGTPAAPAPTADAVAPAREGDAPRRSAESAAARADDERPMKKEMEAPPLALGRHEAEEDKAFRDRAALPVATAAEARRAREAWRQFVAEHPTGARADEGRLRLVEAGLAVHRLTGAAEDREIARRDARAYLADPAARQAARVRALLRALETDR